MKRWLRKWWRYLWCPSRWYCRRAKRVECDECGYFLNRLSRFGKYREFTFLGK